MNYIFRCKFVIDQEFTENKLCTYEVASNSDTTGWRFEGVLQNGAAKAVVERLARLQKKDDPKDGMAAC